MRKFFSGLIQQMVIFYGLVQLWLIEVSGGSLEGGTVRKGSYLLVALWLPDL